MEEFLQVVLQGSSRKQQLVLEGVTIQHTEELEKREQGIKWENKPKHTHKYTKGLLSHRLTKKKNLES